MTARQRLIAAFQAEYVDDLLQGDYEALADLAFAALREPPDAAVDLFLQELDDAPANRPDPSAAEADAVSRRTTERRLAITYAWRRAFDLMKRGQA